MSSFILWSSPLIPLLSSLEEVDVEEVVVEVEFEVEFEEFEEF